MRALEIENRFRRLDGLLHTVRNKRIRTVLVFEFIDEVWDDREKFRSYIPLTAQYLPEAMDSADWSGVSPEQSVGWIETAKKVNRYFENTIQEPFIDQLTELHLLTLLLIGELTRFLDTAEQFGFIPPSLHSNSDISGQINDILASASSTDQAPDEEKDSISNVLRLYRRAAAEKSNSILIPTQAYIDSYPENSYGSLREMSIKIYEIMQRGQDVVETNFAVASTENAPDYFIQKVIEPTRSYLETHFQDLDSSHVRVYFKYLRNVGIHDGESSNAALALLFVAELHRYFDKRKRLSIQKTVAITGGLNADGTIGEVSEESVFYKVIACFFSRIETLVVPESQKEQFRVNAKALAELYPNKEFQILGVSTLDDLFSDRRIIRSEEISITRHLSGKLCEKKFEASGLILIVCLMFIILRLTYGPIDKNPVMGEFTGEVLQVKNQYGTILKSVDVGAYTVNRALSNGRWRLSAFADVTGDDINEIFWGNLQRHGNSNNSGFLHKESVLQNSPDWTIPLRYEIEFPRKPEVFNSSFVPSTFEITDLNGDSRQSLVVVLSHTLYFPGILSIRNPTNGKEVSHFLNTGRIQNFIAEDITGDGDKEIIFCGVNNAYDTAFLAVLKWDNVQGHSPLTEQYSVLDYDLNPEIQYILIPKSIVGQNIASHRQYNLAESIEHHEEEEIIQVRVTDYMQYSGASVEHPSTKTYLYFYFNYDLSLRGVGTSDGYDLTAEYLFEEGIIDMIPDYQYFESYQEKLQYWNGEKFVRLGEFSNYSDVE